MPRDPRYDVLFEPVRIGPVTARNRFYQVPHCCGMGYRHPSAMATMRGVKAEGGWAVVSTEECEIHWTSDVSPYVEARLWEDRDIPALARMTDRVHAHGSLAACELVHNSHSVSNRFSRESPIGPSHLPAIHGHDPVQARAMSKRDIREFRRWHREAALRARTAGFDVIYCYAGHGITLPMHFISRRRNHRTDEYGGSLENRVRLFRETIEEAKDAVGDTCAVAVRVAVDELMGPDGITSEGEGREVVEMLAELPDLWDVNVSDWPNDSMTARFAEEGYQEPYIAFVKKLTTKPVVGVGRFTSPDAMVSQVKRGILDFIGAARPSIADPFLPLKIEQGRADDIRECIGCNICVSGDYTQVPIRCTQNPTMGEEWRRGWHPERIGEKGSGRRVLVVGAGPAGLECARALGQRGYSVTLAEATETLGGRVDAESRLPGLATWARVRDWRAYQIDKLANVEVFRASRLKATDVREFGAQVVAIATGSHWRRDGMGRQHPSPVPGAVADHVFTPEDVMQDRVTEGPVVIYDDDHFYLGGVLAEKLRAEGLDVTLATPAPEISEWTSNTMEQWRIQRKLMEMGVEPATNRSLAGIHDGEVELACTYTDRRSRIPARSVVLVTARLPDDALYHELLADPDALAGAGIEQVECIGDALAPATIAAAVWSGHRFARELDEPRTDGVPFKRELAQLSDE